MNTGYSQYPPSYQETIAPGAPTGPSQINGPSGFTPSTEFYVGQHTGRRGSNGHGAPLGKTMRVGNATYSGMRNDCYEGFCENCQINVSPIKKLYFKRVKIGLLDHLSIQKSNLDRDPT